MSARMFDSLAPVVVRESLEKVLDGAGQVVLEHYGRYQEDASSLEVTTKDDQSPVTAADEAADAYIRREIGSVVSDIAMLSEEGGPGDVAATASHWLVDPLDGTKEFLSRNGEFTVNVALVHSGRPVFGGVLSPTTGEMFFGMPGRGAFVRRNDEWSPVAPSEPSDVVRVVVSRSHSDERTERVLTAIAADGLTVETLPMGSSVKLCSVACGRADFYPRMGPTMWWDTAAADAVVEAAGAATTDLQGVRLRYAGADRHNPAFVVAAPWLEQWRRWLPGATA